MANYVKVQGPDGEVIGLNGVPTGHYTTHQAVTPADIIAGQMLAQRERQQHVQNMPHGQGMSVYQSDLRASQARAEAALAAQRQQEAQREAMMRAQQQKNLLDQKFPGMKPNDSWFSNMLGLSDGQNQGAQANGIAGLMGLPTPAGGGPTQTHPGTLYPYGAPANWAGNKPTTPAAPPLPPLNHVATAQPGDVNVSMPDSVKDIPTDPAVKQYKNLLSQYEQNNEGALYQGDQGSTNSLLPDGSFGTDSSGSSTSSNNGLSVTYSSLAGKGFGYVLYTDPASGKKTVESVATALEKISASAQRDPKQAAELMTSLAAMGAYTGGADTYVQDRLYLKGKTLNGQWTKDDITALANGLQMATQEQASEVEANPQTAQGITEIMSQLAMKNQNLALSTPGGSVGTGGSSKKGSGWVNFGGGGGGWSSGGGGGGFAKTQTDPSVITDLANQTASGMIGRKLSPAEAAQFVQYYHGLESGDQFDLGYASEGIPAEAATWLQQHLGGEYNAQQYGNYYTDFVQLLQNGLGNTQ